MLTPQQIARYERDGFLVIEGFATLDACASLRRRAVELVEAFEPTTERTVFTTHQQERTATVSSSPQPARLQPPLHRAAAVYPATNWLQRAAPFRALA